MLKRRLIPIIILREGMVVQSRKFIHTNIIHSDVRIVVEHFSRWEADELAIIDVSPTLEHRQKFYCAIKSLAGFCFAPLAVGGWIKDLKEVLYMLRLGADKVIINTQAFKHPSLVEECAKRCGSQCIIGGIDVRKTEAGKHEVYVDRGRTATGMSPEVRASELEQMGAGEIYLTSIDHDGARQGYDIELVRSVVDSVGIPVIAFGGVSKMEHFAEGIVAGGASAVAAANFFHYIDYSAKKAKTHLCDAGLDVRSCIS